MNRWTEVPAVNARRLQDARRPVTRAELWLWASAIVVWIVAALEAASVGGAR